MWGRSWASVDDAAAALAEAIGLALERRGGVVGRLLDILVAPVVLFWGDLRTRRPERQLRRFTLRGSRADRALAIELGDERAKVTLGCRGSTPLWADLGAASLEAEEGLRALYPIGGPRWIAGETILRALAASRVARVALDDGALCAVVPIDALAPAQAPPLLDRLIELAALLERP